LGQGEGERSVILTFDDGPLPAEALLAILDALDTERIRGTFFLLGEVVARHPDLAKAIHNRGHEIGNHNWRHAHMPRLAEQEMRDQLRRTQEAVRAATGAAPKRLRPPYGEGWINDKCPALLRTAASLDLKLTGWSLDTFDWRLPHGVRFERVREYFKGCLDRGETSRLDLLMHVHYETARDLPVLIEYVRSLGFTFTSY